ncbi:hypothetical protein V6Z12_D05G271900 [Gossypium hirsutum]
MSFKFKRRQRKELGAESLEHFCSWCIHTVDL